ncbi:MAG: tetratricopeptide repeat protein [Flavobacteriales bacterium]|nr:tetratricopeptide repeat protein [Flavobacteriales bacterium]
MKLQLAAILSASALFFYACNDPAEDQSSDQTSQEVETVAIDTVQVRLDSLNQRIIADPVNADNYLERAHLYAEKGDVNRTLEDFSNALDADSTRDDVFFARGEYHYGRTDFELAVVDYQACVDLSPENTDCLLKLGEMQIHLQNYPKALEEINKALTVNEFLPFGYYMKGRIYKETGDTTLAASSYQTAIEVDPEYYDAYIEIGLLYASAKSDLAIEYYRTATEIKPQSIEAKYNLAYYLQSSGDRDANRYTQAFKQYKEILEIDPEFVPAYYNQGYIHLEYFQHYDSAITFFDQAADIYPAYYQAYYNRGLCYESLGNKQEALADYNRALSMQPDYTPAALAKGRVLGE